MDQLIRIRIKYLSIFFSGALRDLFEVILIGTYILNPLQFSGPFRNSMY